MKSRDLIVRVLLLSIGFELGCTARASRHLSARTTVASIQPYSARVRASYCAERAYELERRDRAYNNWKETTLGLGVASVSLMAGMLLATGPIDKDSHVTALEAGAAFTGAAGTGLLIGALLFASARSGLDQESQRAISGATIILDRAEYIEELPAGESAERAQAEAKARTRIEQAFKNCTPELDERTPAEAEVAPRKLVKVPPPKPDASPPQTDPPDAPPANTAPAQGAQ